MKRVRQRRSKAICLSALAIAGASQASAQTQLPSTVTIWPTTANFAENAMVSSIAGIVNRTTNGELLISKNDGAPPNARYWLDRLKEQYPQVQSQVQSNTLLLVNQYKSKLSGYVLYDRAANPDSLNIATSLAGVLNAMIVDPSTQFYANVAQLPQLADARSMTYASAHSTYGPQFNKDMLFHQASSFDYQLRDYAVMKKGFTYFTDPTALNPYAANQNPQGRIFGWGNSEFDLFNQASQNNQQVVASNHNQSSSTTSQWKVPIQPQKYHAPASVQTQAGKHYVAFVMSDGDNVTWLTNGMGQSPQWFGSPHRGKFNMTWDYTPSLMDMNPVAHNWFYQNAADGTYKDNFVAAGGAGTAFPSQSPDIAGLANSIGASMAAADLKVTSILDPSYTTAKLYPIVDDPRVMGMMFKTYDNFYKGRNGALEFRNGKPILSVRYSLWDGADSAQSLAAALNNAPRDPLDNTGSYSIVNVHPWSTAGPTGTGTGDPMSNLGQLVQWLDSSKVEVVGLEELMIHLRNHFGTPLPGAQITGTWNRNGSSSWNIRTNWSGAIPNFLDATVNFGSIITQARSVTTDIAVTAGSINFASAQPYTIGGASVITLNTSGADAAINVTSGSHTINAPLALAKNTTVNVTPANSTLTVSNLQTSALTLSKTGAGTLVVNNVRAGGLNVNVGTVRIAKNGAATGTSKVSALTVAPTAKLDLTDNKLIVAAGDIGSWNGANYTGITGMIQSGRGDGSYNGAGGIVTSMTSATTSVLTTLAIATSGETSYGGATFGGQNVGDSDVLIMYTWGGDADLNGELNGDDYFRIDSNILQSGSVFGYYNGDFNYDGEMNGDDYFIIDSNIVYAQNSPPFQTGAGAGTLSAIPEPGCGTMLLTALFPLVARLRKSPGC